jgi:hypothetical protein
MKNAAMVLTFKCDEMAARVKHRERKGLTANDHAFSSAASTIPEA